MKKTYAYLQSDPPGVVTCFSSPAAVQVVSRFAEAETLSALHDQSLQEATRRINAILDEVRQLEQEDRILSIIESPHGPFLVWARYAQASYWDDEEVINRALGLPPGVVAQGPNAVRRPARNS